MGLHKRPITTLGAKIALAERRLALWVAPEKAPFVVARTHSTRVAHGASFHLFGITKLHSSRPEGAR